MTSSHLTDLDSLQLSVRDKNSAAYIGEAIIAYRAGAYRAAVISAWVAVCYDIVAKIRELAANGDPNAGSFIGNFDLQVQKRNIPKMLEIEDGLLDTAKKDFELINDHEHEDLHRLKKDRALCAHPAFSGAEVLFQPTPELVRTHIVHVIFHVLCVPPVQGKSAIDSVMAAIESLAFPSSRDAVFHFLNGRYLARAKDALLRNLTIVLLKRLLREDVADPQKILHSLQALFRTNAKIYRETVADKLPQLFDVAYDEGFGRVFLLLATEPEVWEYLQEHQKLAVTSYLSNLPTIELAESLSAKYHVFRCLDVLPLQEVLLEFFGRLSSRGQIEAIASDPHPLLSRNAVQLFATAGSYRYAELLGEKVLLPMAPVLSAADVCAVLEKARTNEDICYAGGMEEILVRFFGLTEVHLQETKNAWAAFIRDRLEKNGERQYYVYERIQTLLMERGIDWHV